jgi:hypothetical protein
MSRSEVLEQLVLSKDSSPGCAVHLLRSPALLPSSSAPIWQLHSYRENLFELPTIKTCLYSQRTFTHQTRRTDERMPTTFCTVQPMFCFANLIVHNRHSFHHASRSKRNAIGSLPK